MTVRRKKLVAVASMAAMVLQTAACDRHTVHPDDARPVPDLSAVADRKVTPDAWADQDAWPDQRVDDLGAADLGPDASPDLPADMSKDKSPYDLLGCYVPPDQKLVLDKVGASKDLKQADAAAKAKGFLLTADHAGGDIVAADKAGNIYIAGYAYKQVNIGGKWIGLPAQWTTIVVKLDSKGKAIWAQQGIVQQGSYAIINDMAVDSKGNTYIVGFFSGQLKIGNATLNTLKGRKYPNSDLFIAKLSPKGAWLWAESAGMGAFFLPSDDEASSIAVDPFDNVLVAGTADTGTVFGSFVHPGGTYIVKLHASGTFLWLATAKGGPTIGALKADGKGAVYAYGDFWGQVSFGKHKLFTPAYKTKAAFVAKLDCMGSYIWATKVPGTNWSSSALDSAGNLYIQPEAGHFAKVGPGGKILKTAKPCQLLKGAGGGGGSIGLSPSGDVYLQLGFMNNTHFVCGTKKFVTQAPREIAIIKASKFGVMKWIERVQGYWNSTGNMVRTKDGVFMTGYYSGEAYFGKKYVKGIKNVNSFYLWKFAEP